jgi:Anaphase-promoting complex, cyclosome, subunit 4
MSAITSLIFRSNRSQQLALDEDAISEALKIHKTLFMRSHELLRQLTIERSSFETFSGWLILMAEDVLANEDTHVEAPPLHTIDTVAVAKYITDHLLHPILAGFASDMQPLSHMSMTIDEYDPYFVLVNRLTEMMKGFFKRAATELREGVSWLVPHWIDLQLHEEIAASDVRIKLQVDP